LFFFIVTDQLHIVSITLSVVGLCVLGRCQPSSGFIVQDAKVP